MNANPAHAVASAPILSCPSAPILNKPALKANATERPVKISGVALNNTCPSP